MNSGLALLDAITDKVFSYRPPDKEKGVGSFWNKRKLKS
jgi:hypothetical protein